MPVLTSFWRLERKIASKFWCCIYVYISSLQFSCSVMSDSLRPHGLQHTSRPCPSPTPRACSNSCASSQWCHPSISFSVIPISSCLQSFPASGSFLISQLFASGGQSFGASTSAISPSNEYSGLISFNILYNPTQILSPWSLQSSNLFQQWKWHDIFIYLFYTFIHSSYILVTIVEGGDTD